MLSQYFEHHYWMEVSELQDYMNVDVHVDPEHNDLPLERLFKVKEGVTESRVCRVNSAKVVVEIQALQECVQTRDILAASIVASGDIRVSSLRIVGDMEGCPVLIVYTQVVSHCLM